MFPTSTYTGRRNALRQKLDSGLVLLLTNPQFSRSYGANVFPYRQDSHFLYFAGIHQSGLALILDIDSGEDTLFGNELTMDDIVWTGELPTLKSRAAKAGITNVTPSDQLAGVLSAAQQAGRKVHFLPPYQAANKVQLFNLLGVHPNESKSSASEALIKAVVSLREIKTAEELVEIEAAVNTTGRMHLAAMGMARPGMGEAEIAAALYREVIGTEAWVSFPPIATVHGEILHAEHYSNSLDSGKLFLCDCGAESAMKYAGDMTRTFPVDSTFTQKQREIYQIVLDAEIQAAAALKPGIAYRDMHLLAARVITDGLKSLGLMKGNTDEAVAAGAHALFFVHGLGHQMGLDVHDMEDLGEDYVGYGDDFQRSKQFGTAFLRLAKTLVPGHVLTVEPGIYFIPALIDQWKNQGTNAEFINFDAVESYKDFGGIRIEEDFVITENGSQLLGDPIPKTIKDVEAVRGLDF